MKRFLSGVTFLLVALLTLSSVKAEELTLDQCIQLALKNRSSVIRARGLARQAGASKLSALGAVLLPSVGGGYSYTKGKETNIDPPNELTTSVLTGIDTIVLPSTLSDTAFDAHYDRVVLETIDEQDRGPSKSLSISADWSLVNFPGWFNFAARGAAKASADLNVLASELDMIQAVKIAYYAYLASVENVDVQRGAVKRAEEQLKLIESRFELGSASKSDVLKQKVQTGNDKLALLRADNTVTTSKTNLAYTIGINPRDDITFSTNYTVQEYQGTLDDAIAYGQTNNPGLLSYEKTSDQAQSVVRSAWSGYLPSLSLFADFQKFNGTQAFPITFDYSSNTTSYGFRISYNIFDGFGRESRLIDAKVFRNNALADLADARNLNVSQIRTSYLDIQALKEQKDVSTENVAAAEEDLKITQEKYNLGAATILDLLDAQVSLKQAQVALIQVEFDLNLAIAKLEKALGKR